MPDFRKSIEDANFKPVMERISTTGPNAAGEQETWQNPRDQLSQSSAAELAELMGATQSQVRYEAGPYSQNKPQWQIDFGGPDKYDAAMVWERYQKNPESFNQQMADELKSSGGPSVVQQEFDAGKLNGGHGAGAGGAGGGGGMGLTPGPKWPDAPPPNIPGPDWEMPAVPGPTGKDPVPLHPGTGVQDPGSYKPGGIPATPSTGFPRPIDLTNGQPAGANAGSNAVDAQLELPQVVTPRGYTPRPYIDQPVSLLNSSGLPNAVQEPGEGPGGLLTQEQLKKRAGGYIPSKYKPPGLITV